MAISTHSHPATADVGVPDPSTLLAGPWSGLSAGGGEATPVVILGAGPAGLTAGYELNRSGIPSVILEKDRVVGGDLAHRRV
ncbi:MAG: NAD(P)-binding protein [Acidobacteriota bacterium]